MTPNDVLNRKIAGIIDVADEDDVRDEVANRHAAQVLRPMVST
jgi:hypothetical protein